MRNGYRIQVFPLRHSVLGNHDIVGYLEGGDWFVIVEIDESSEFLKPGMVLRLGRDQYKLREAV
jgi:hypothetical protein